jgi:hypothetical protein
MRFIPVQNEFVAEVENIDVAAPLDAPGVSAIHAGMDRKSLVGPGHVVRGVELDLAEALGKSDLLRVGERLVVEHQHGVANVHSAHRCSAAGRRLPGRPPPDAYHLRTSVIEARNVILRAMC